MDAPGTFVTVDGENQVRWGTDIGSGQSGLGFTGTEAVPQALCEDQEFEIGTLRHFNEAIDPPRASAVDLTLELTFSDPSLHPSFTFKLAIDETENEEPCPYPSTTPCSDRVSFPSAFPSETFDVGGVTFTLEVVGFRPDPLGPIISEFISEEGGTSSALLFGRLTTSIPGPRCMDMLATITGTDGDDILIGTPSDDVIVALRGNDIVVDNGGDDVVCLGAGNDLAADFAGNDRIFGEEGVDRILSGPGSDLLDGGPNFDLCVGGQGFDISLNCEFLLGIP